MHLLSHCCDSNSAPTFNVLPPMNTDWQLPPAASNSAAVQHAPHWQLQFDLYAVSLASGTFPGHFSAQGANAIALYDAANLWVKDVRPACPAGAAGASILSSQLPPGCIPCTRPT